jgi:D-glycero-D-manno-heptose 1,7-bisphosphate phosphatase
VRRAVFLDRDGVINRAVVRLGKPYPPASLAEMELLPGVVEAATRLRNQGFVLIAVTNQPDVARGTTPRATVDAINNAVQQALGLDEVMTCFHDDSDGCDCRKPLPGHFFRARDAYGLDLGKCFMIGDRWRDMLAAQNGNIRSIFIDYQYAEPYKAAPPGFICASLVDAANYIIETAVPAPSL